MQKQDSRLDFSGQRVEVGLDVDKKHWDVCIRVGGVEHRTFHQPPAVEPLVKYLRRNFPGAEYRCVYEAGCFGFWIHDALRAAGVECIVVSPADVPTSDRERRRRNAHLRRCLIEASWVAMRKDPALLQRFTRLTQRMCKTRAIIRIARSLLSRIRYVLKHQEPYQLRVVQ